MIISQNEIFDVEPAADVLVKIFHKQPPNQMSRFSSGVGECTWAATQHTLCAQLAGGPLSGGKPAHFLRACVVA